MHYLHICHDFYTADFKNKITIAVPLTVCVYAFCTMLVSQVENRGVTKNYFFLITKFSSSFSLHSSARLQTIMPH